MTASAITPDDLPVLPVPRVTDAAVAVSAPGSGAGFWAGAPSALLYLRVASVRDAVARLRARGTPIEAEPHVIFTHDDDALGPTGSDEWHAFLRDSEGNLLGLVSHEPHG